VVKDEQTGRLLMWFDVTYAHPGGLIERGISGATSQDGKHWTRLRENPLFLNGGAWPGALYDAEAPADHRFKMWYNVYPGREIKYAWSADGIAWQGHETVLLKGAQGEFDDLNVAAPSVLRGRDGEYMMYYDAGSSSVTERAGFPNNHYLALATSSDGEHWTKRGVALERGKDGDWDGGRIYNACVIYDADENHYEMWYAGRPRVSEMAGTTTGGVGYAVSLDGIKWVKSARNPDLPSSPDSLGLDRSVAAASVLKDENGYRMWFTGEDVIAYAELPLNAYQEEHDALRSGH